MNRTFLDTSYLLALLNTDDEDHQRARDWQHVLRGPFITTEYVLVELMNAMSSPAVRQVAQAAADMLRADARVKIIWGGEALFQEGLERYRTRPDKAWSLTDCISFLMMEREDLDEALTADRHFEQAGFRALLLLKPEHR